VRFSVAFTFNKYRDWKQTLMIKNVMAECFKLITRRK
jgi:hypothetical protein